jgi:transcription antitermination factor NusG
LLHKVRFTRGVYDVVSFGHYPTPVDDEIIAIIKSYVSDDGLVRIGADFRLGDKVVVSDGALKGFTGIFEQEIKADERVKILLETVSYQAHAVLNKQLIRRIT